MWQQWTLKYIFNIKTLNMKKKVNVLMRTYLVLFLFCFFFGTSLAQEKATVISRNEIILYVIDTIWAEYLTCYCYTSTFNGKTKVEVEPGIHTFEFKYPKVGWSGKVYSARFDTEAGKTYLITSTESNGYNVPIIIDQSNEKEIGDAIIKQISIPKPDAKIIRLPNVVDNNYATIVSSCCSGLYDKRGRLKDMGGLINICKIDSFYGPFSIGWHTLYNNTWNGQFQIELTPGTHKFYLYVTTVAGIHTVIGEMSFSDKSNFLHGVQYNSKNIICLSVDMEAGMTYGFDYKLIIDSEKKTPERYDFDIEIVETYTAK